MQAYSYAAKLEKQIEWKEIDSVAVIDLTDEVGNTDSGSNADNNKSIHIGIICQLGSAGFSQGGFLC